MKLSVIVPVYNGGEQLRQCLRALAASIRRPDEIVLVDDGSTDDAPELAGSLGIRVVRIEDGPRGPAVARNRGAASCPDTALLVFIDADVVVQPQTIGLIEDYFARHAQVAAIFGSYDAAPPARNTASLYKNLLHHYTHQHSDREASTFWAGCGAIRAEAFRQVGGFSENYSRPSIEDIELGARLREAGRVIHLCPEIQVTHLKRWSLGSMIRTDIFSRALPWSRLLMTQGELPDELNLRMKNRVSALVAIIFVAALAGALVLPELLFLAVAAGAIFAALNWHLLKFFAARGGIVFGIGAGLLHLLYYVYSSIAFGWVAISTAPARWRRSQT